MAGRKKVEQLGLFGRRGGKRRGAGRKPKGSRAGASHRKRPKLLERYPVHVVLRAASGVGNLRRRDTYLAVQKATECVADRDDFRIAHLSIQRNHLHLVVEAVNEAALSWHLQRFQISAARRINAVTLNADGTPRRGAVFPDRYHATILKTPTQARNAIAYALGNWRKHGEDRGDFGRTWKIDWFASAISFTGWAEYNDPDFPRHGPDTYIPLRVDPARTWLLSEGWRRGGPPISCTDVPSSRI